MTKGRATLWSVEDLNFIDAHPDMPKERLAEALQRETWEVAAALGRLRSSVVSEPWTMEEDEFILATQHLSARQVAVQIERTYDAVTSRRKVLAREHGVNFGSDGTKKDPYHIGARPLIAKTCTKCGLLLASEWFAFMPARGGVPAHWRISCKKCVSASGYASVKKGTNNYKGSDRYKQKTAQSRKRLQDLTTSRATRSGQDWIEADYKVLQDPDLTLLEKALKLGRSYNAVAIMCSRQNYKSHVGLGSAEKDQWYIDNPNAKEYAL
jgi:hypothetical protein